MSAIKCKWANIEIEKLPLEKQDMARKVFERMEDQSKMKLDCLIMI